MSLKKYWRVAILILLITVSVLFIGGVIGGHSQTTTPNPSADSPTNLQFSVELSGGIRVRAPLSGHTATGVDVQPGETQDMSQNIAKYLDDVSTSSIEARPPSKDRKEGAIEITDPETTKDEFTTAIEKAGYSYSEIRRGVTKETREQTIEVLRDKINQAGLSGGEVRDVETSTGEHLVLIVAPNRDLQDIVKLAEDRGQVVVEAYYPVNTDNGVKYQTEVVLEREDFQSIGQPVNREGSQPNVPVVIKQENADEFRQVTMSTGVASEGGTTCSYEVSPENTQPCLLTKVDDEVVYSAGMSPGLANSIRNGEWVKDPQFVLQTSSMEQAKELSINLRAGALPASVDIESGGASTSYTSPTRGDQFKKLSLIIGLLSAFAVGMMSFLRYRNMKIAGSMILTAISEVVILLGFAAAISYPIDLATVAGLIAVVGTGVDDLIILTNEILGSEQKVKTLKMFKKRFRKALWVIVSAALTTIIAMSPLAVLSLGDLRGFAIFTILGVIVGVTITRPAYGDLLRFMYSPR